MNILIVHEVDWLQKVTYEIHHLSEIFSMKGHQVFAVDIPNPVFSLKRMTGETILNYHRIYEKSSVTLFRTPIIPIKGISRISGYFSSYSFLKNILQKYDIDVVLLYSVVTNAKATIKACSELQIPVIHRTFDVIHDLIREKYLRSSVLKIEKLIYPKFDKVIANTTFMKKWSEEMGSRNVIVISQGIDPNIMKMLPKDLQLLQNLGLSEIDKVVMYLGSIESFSGLNQLIEKISYIVKNIPSFKLLVVGGGSHLEDLKNKTKKLKVEDKVIFTGYRPYAEIPRYCSLAILCVNTFIVNEMTKKLSPVKIFDLQACGKSILATPLEGLLYDFPESDSSVIYSELDSFPNKIIDLLQDEQGLSRIGLRGMKFVQTNFTWDEVANKMIKEMEESIASNRN